MLSATHTVLWLKPIRCISVLPTVVIRLMLTTAGCSLGVRQFNLSRNRRISPNQLQATPWAYAALQTLNGRHD